MQLRYLYVGSSETARDLMAWLALEGASMPWRFQHFGADVAAVSFAAEGSHPAILLADHRPPGSILPIYAVDDPEQLSEHLASSGWEVVAGPLGTPEGPATVLRDPSGTEIALLQVERPSAMEIAYGDPANQHAVRGGDARGADAPRPAPNPHTGTT